MYPEQNFKIRKWASCVEKQWMFGSDKEGFAWKYEWINATKTDGTKSEMKIPKKHKKLQKSRKKTEMSRYRK
jgi:hypothetical protein